MADIESQDSWGNHYTLELQTNHSIYSYALRSSGPDGVHGTADDLVQRVDIQWLSSCRMVDWRPGTVRYVFCVYGDDMVNCLGIDGMLGYAGELAEDGWVWQNTAEIKQNELKLLSSLCWTCAASDSRPFETPFVSVVNLRRDDNRPVRAAYVSDSRLIELIIRLNKHVSSGRPVELDVRWMTPSTGNTGRATKIAAACEESAGCWRCRRVDRRRVRKKLR